MVNAPQQAAAQARAVAARVLTRVAVENRYLDTALDEARADWSHGDGATFALIQELAYGTLRWHHQLTGIARLFISRPLKPKDADVQALLLLGLYQLRHMRVPEYAAVDATVRAADTIAKGWAKGILNACLRGYLRDVERVEAEIGASEELRYSHPAWLIETVRQDHPADGERILTANNARPPLTLRVNLARLRREQYLESLRAEGIEARAHAVVASAVTLQTPVPVDRLPGFAAGQVSVQDAAAQLAAALLDAKPGERVLDACAAPGGKAAHILEHTPGLRELTALDADPARLERVRQSLGRLGLSAKSVAADAMRPGEWWDGAPYDRILLDVPCSATGVIRRHPDIKLRRQPGDLPKLTDTQARLLDGVWPCLARGGKLLYATCSILRDENDHQVRDFIARQRDAVVEPLARTGAPLGLQLLPGDNNMDGFYYARLRKT